MEQGADVNHVGLSGSTALDYACKNGHVEIVRLLLDRLAAVESRDSGGATPLHTATLFGQVEAARLLLQRGAKVNAKDNAGWTPLHFAAKNGDANIAKVLVENGADVNACARMGQTPLHLNPFDSWPSEDSEAMQELAGFLRSSAQDAHSRMADIEEKVFGKRRMEKGKGDYEAVVRILLQSGTNPGIKDKNGLTALQLAKANNKYDVVRILNIAGINE